MQYSIWVIILCVIVITIVAYFATAILADAPFIQPAPSIATAMLLANSSTPVEMYKTDIDDQGSVGVTDVTTDGTDGAIGGAVVDKEHKDVKTASIKQEQHYDEYEDISLRTGIDERYLQDKENIVIDGNNLMYYLGYNNSLGYIEFMKRTIKFLAKTFKDKEVFFVMKDPPTDELKKASLEEMKMSSKLQYVQAFRQFANKFLKSYKNVHIVVSYGDSKSRDDYAMIYLVDNLPKSILLTRDRFSDMNKTSTKINEDVRLTVKVYGKDHAKHEKIFTSRILPSIGDWSIKGILVGFALASKNDTTGFYNKRVNKRSRAGDMVFLINKDEF
jgi:hypothetical protein